MRHVNDAFLLRLSFATEILKFLVPLFDTSRQMLSQLSNLILRQSEDAANADPMNNVTLKTQTSIVRKSFFMSVMRKNIKYIHYYNNLYNEFNTKIKSFLKMST
jgi:hypothetical protein